MRVVNDEGRLFGVVNVIDAFVVLAAVAVVAAGVALVAVDSEESNREQTRYTTIAFEDLPPSAAQALEAGQTFTVVREDAGPTVNITDVVVTSGPNGTAVAVARATVSGAEEIGALPVTIGRMVRLTDGRFGYNATVVEHNRSERTLTTDETRVALTATVPAAVAERIDTNTTFTVGTKQVGRVESVSVVPTQRPETVSLRVGAVVETVRVEGRPTVAGVPLRYGATIPLGNDAVNLDATVRSVGTTSLPGEKREVSTTVTWSDIDPMRADAVREGFESAHRGGDARLTGVEQSPAQVVVMTADGQVTRQTHPANRTLTLTVDVTARQTRRGLLFHGRQLTVGQPVILEFSPVTVDGRLARVDQ